MKRHFLLFAVFCIASYAKSEVLNLTKTATSIDDWTIVNATLNETATAYSTYVYDIYAIDTSEAYVTDFPDIVFKMWNSGGKTKAFSIITGSCFEYGGKNGILVVKNTHVGDTISLWVAAKGSGGASFEDGGGTYPKNAVAITQDLTLPAPQKGADFSDDYGYIWKSIKYSSLGGDVEIKEVNGGYRLRSLTIGRVPVTPTDTIPDTPTDTIPDTPTDTIPDTPVDTTYIPQYEVDATMTPGTSASTAKVNGKTAVKCGTSNRPGDMTVTVGAGAVHLTLYIATWYNISSVSAAIEAPEGVTVWPSALTLVPDSGITGNTPFTLKGNEETYKHSIFLKGVTAEKALKISCDKRFVVWGATYGTDSVTTPTDTIPDTPTDTIPSTLSISVAQALEIASTLSVGGTTPQSYTITGYVSEAEAYNEAYQNQSFWITDTKGSTANTNDQGALYVYRGVASSPVKAGNKISITTAIRKYRDTLIETVSLSPVTILDSDTIHETPTDTIPSKQDSTYYNITVQADNSENGTVMGGGEYKKGETAVIMATPRKDCTFEGWSDGNTLNPRSVLVTGDAEYTAIFRRDVPLPVVTCSDTMYFTSADSTLLAIRVYSASEIQPYDKIIIATTDNKNVMGSQTVEGTEMRSFRTAVEYIQNMNISNISVVEAIPNGPYFRLRVADGELAPRCEDCYQKLNQLYATEIGADWYFARYENSVVPEAAAYANRMILYNDEAPRFSSYRQVTGLNRTQTTVFKLRTPRIIPQTPEEIPVDTASMIEEEKPMEDIPVEIEPQDTAAVISTPYVEFVHSYTLIVWADESRTQVLMTITYDAEGHQISVTRPEAVRRRAPQPASVSFEIGNLEPIREYPYTLIACEDDGSILTSLNSSFATTNGTEDIWNVSDNQSQIIKFLLNGQLFILRDGKLYNALGTQVK